MKILIIDDSNTSRYVAVKVIRDLGYKDVTAVASAEEGLVRLKGDKFDLVLLDWNLDGMSGVDFLKVVREDPSLKNIAVIMVTTVNERKNVVQALKLGVQGYIFKPVTKTMFDAKLKEIEAKFFSRQPENNPAATA